MTKPSLKDARMLAKLQKGLREQREYNADYKRYFNKVIQEVKDGYQVEELDAMKLHNFLQMGFALFATAPNSMSPSVREYVSHHTDILKYRTAAIRCADGIRANEVDDDDLEAMQDFVAILFGLLELTPRQEVKAADRNAQIIGFIVEGEENKVFMKKPPVL